MAQSSLIPDRKKLPHHLPHWVRAGSTYFITICCTPRGRNQLCRPTVAQAIEESLQHRQNEGIWFVPLLLLMPDHLHALMAFHPDRQLKRVVRDWKRYLAGNQGIRWQRDFFEHRLRRPTERAEKYEYIRQNPVRARLIEKSEDWPYCWSAEADWRDRD